MEILTSELVSNSTGVTMDCSVKKIASKYEISYQGVIRGRHHLHIKVEGEHIEGSPFPVIVMKKFGTPIKIIDGVKWPWGVAVNQMGEAIVAEGSAHRISIFNRIGEKAQSFGSRGTGRGKFYGTHGVVVDDGGSILVVDCDNNRIQKFTPNGDFVATVGKKGNNPLEFSEPLGIAIHPLNKRVYVADFSNHHLQILNPDLTLYTSFGSYDSGHGQLSNPWDMAFDSAGNVYVADSQNHRIQVFTSEGEFLRTFGKKGCGNSEFSGPTGISIDSDNVVYVVDCNNHRVSVFTCDGKFLTSFGTHGSGPGQFKCPRGLAVDKNGVVYVSDSGNNRLQLF